MTESAKLKRPWKRFAVAVVGKFVTIRIRENIFRHQLGLSGSPYLIRTYVCSPEMIEEEERREDQVDKDRKEEAISVPPQLVPEVDSKATTVDDEMVGGDERRYDDNKDGVVSAFVWKKREERRFTSSHR